MVGQVWNLIHYILILTPEELSELHISQKCWRSGKCHLETEGTHLNAYWLLQDMWTYLKQMNLAVKHF